MHGFQVVLSYCAILRMQLVGPGASASGDGTEGERHSRPVSNLALGQDQHLFNNHFKLGRNHPQCVYEAALDLGLQSAEDLQLVLLPKKLGRYGVNVDASL